MHSQDDPSDVLAHVAANLRRYRADAGMSQEALAQASGLSRRMISNLESGDTNISLSKLASLSRALGVGFAAMVANPAASTAKVEEIAWRGATRKSFAVLLGTAPARSLAELWSWSIDVGDTYQAEPDPVGWYEMITVSVGRLRINKQDGSVVVKAGDFTIFDSAQPYSYENIGDEVLHFTRVVVC